MCVPDKKDNSSHTHILRDYIISHSLQQKNAEILLFPTLYAVFLVSEAIVGISAYQLYKRFSKDKDYPAMHTAHFEPVTLADCRWEEKYLGCDEDSELTAV